MLIRLIWTIIVAGSAGSLWGQWMPPEKVSRQELIAVSKDVLARPEMAVRVSEDIFRIRVLGMDWDIGAAVYTPEDAARIPTGADGKKAGIFLLHGGSADHRSQAGIARLLAGKFGFKVVTMSYPGRLYLLDKSRDWPGDTIHPDGTVRTPIWNRDIPITPDQYEVVEDKDPVRRKRWGTLILACAKEGTEFYYRMAGWPAAFEEGAKELMRRHFPEREFSIYIHGHSTGGPFANAFSQRVPNIAGILGMESSPFGYICERSIGASWGLPFNCLRIRNWRDIARYAGPEALARDGPEALMQLPMLMESVLESWKKSTASPQFKAEDIIHFNDREALRQAALVTARRLKMSDEETKTLVNKYISYTRELRGEGVKPVPPLLLGIAKVSRDQSLAKYQTVVLPMYAAMNPPPKIQLIQFDAGIHSYTRAEPDLPMGPFPAVAKVWYEAIVGGYFKSR